MYSVVANHTHKQSNTVPTTTTQGVYCYKCEVLRLLLFEFECIHNSGEVSAIERVAITRLFKSHRTLVSWHAEDAEGALWRCPKLMHAPVCHAPGCRYEIAAENKRLSEPLARALKEVEVLRAALASAEKDRASLAQAKARLAAAEKQASRVHSPGA